MKKKTSRKSEKTSKKFDVLPPILQKTLELLKVNPTSKFIISKTGRDKRTVARDMIRLIKKGYIERIDRGYFKIKKDIKNRHGTKPRHQTKPSTLKSDNDYFRLHNIQIQLRLNKKDHRSIKNLIYSDEKGFELKDRNNKNGVYFRVDVRGLLTKENLFIFLPADFDITGDSIPETYAKLDSYLRDILRKWENVFKLVLYKSGRVNYEIVNQHLSIVNNGIAADLNKHKIANEVKVYDDEDGKVAYMFDQSKGFDELESPHSTKAADYIDKARRFMERIKNGEVEAVFEEYNDLKTVSMQNSLLLKFLIKPMMDAEKEKVKPPEDKSLSNYFG